MAKGAKYVGLFAVLGFGGTSVALAYWFYLYLTQGDQAPTLIDFFDTAKSYISRGWLIVKGEAQNIPGVTADPLSIAAGFIAKEEGYSAKPYADPPGQSATYSIGYGHQIIDGDGLSLNSHLSESEALDLLSADLQRYSDCVDNAVTVDLSAQQKAALISLCYNIGCKAFSGSTVARQLNAGNIDEAIAAFSLWNKAGGQINQNLVARRQREADLFSIGTDGGNNA